MGMYTLLYLKWINKDLLYIAQGTLLNVMCQTGLVLGRLWGGWIHVYVWLSPLRFTWNYHNTNWL